MLRQVSHVHCSLARTEFTATVAQMHIGQHAILSKTMQNGDNYLKDGHLMPPERPWIDGLSMTWRPIHVDNITRRASIPWQSQWSHQTPPKLFDVYFALSTSSQFQLTTTWMASKTGHRLTIPFPFWRGVQSTEVCRWKNSIRLSPQSLTKDPRPQSIAICDLDPTVSPCLNVSLYS